VAGSGKSKLIDLASVIATGHEAAVISQGASEEEMEKRLGSALLAGDPIVSIDNCERPLGGELLCQMLTQTRVRTRILGESSTPALSTGAFVAATGNNLALSGDLTRRALLCRLDPRCERPELRVFDLDPVAAAKARRPVLVVAAITVLRAFHVAGRPGKPVPLGSFEAWSDLIRGALLWLGCADPVESIDSVRRADPRLADLAAVAEQWHAVIGAERLTVGEVIRRATERRQGIGGTEVEFSYPELREALLTVAGAGGAINSRRLGKWLTERAGRIVNGLRFAGCEKRQGSLLWALEALPA
jgi:putative DNA primase/helicase